MKKECLCGYDTAVIKENFDRVRAELERASSSSPAGRVPTLIAATKTVPAEVINYAARELGLSEIGENRVQELLSKYDLLDKSLKLHFIGTLQKNKVKYIVDKVSMIHSVDSVSLAEEIGKRSMAIGKTMDILLEVNIGREHAKGGFLPEEVELAAAKIADIPGVSLRGLMTMAPKCDKKEDYLKYFEETYLIFVDFLSKNKHNIIEPVLSMGMSDSYREAASVGATAVRIGSALFGARSVPTPTA